MDIPGRYHYLDLELAGVAGDREGSPSLASLNDEALTALAFMTPALHRPTGAAKSLRPLVKSKGTSACAGGAAGEELESTAGVSAGDPGGGAKGLGRNRNAGTAPTALAASSNVGESPTGNTPAKGGESAVKRDAGACAAAA